MNLDDSQRRVVEITADERQVVVAGPGAGKTEVVAALVEHLIDEQGVDADGGVLVVSFSNAAVFAVEARLRKSQIGPVTVRTMDSLAGEALGDLAEDETEGLSFDERIEMATRIIADGWERLERIEHLIIDEVQDVVGVRADFLIQVVQALPEDSGFTALGDPAQGIYDFQIRPDNNGRPPKSTTTSQQLITELVESGGAVERVLEGQYRARSRDAVAAAGLRRLVLIADGSSAIEDFVARTPRGGTVADVVRTAERWPGRTAFLTETNGQALLTSAEIAASGASVELRRRADQRVLASWIAKLLADAPAKTLSRGAFDDLLDEHDTALDGHRSWLGIRGLVGGRGSEIDIPRLASRLKSRRALPPNFLDAPAADFVVSTVHRAKGLEFDNVVLVEFQDKPWIAANEPADESRRRFVAITRAKNVIVRANGPDDRNVVRGRASRWFVKGRMRWQTFGVELTVGDLDQTKPGGADQAVVQARLQHDMGIGDPLAFRLDPMRSTLELPVYDVLHQDLVISRTSTEFGESLSSRLGPRKGRAPWPALSGARVESVGTVAGQPQTGSVGRHGLWLAPFAVGMLNVSWKGTDDVKA
ncbi:UvrD-helicase domain-containing protein [Planctomonas psychrotolerans]|uniref:UvrD-helicase domain-containing protein n=1 Tax=Planctomonas psychrotolerans TaxID=2528712 RepID=UPI001D0D1D52|nr:UvrD-helicase domain-containing protein [Planctomonas psychrotolerans]